jgi:hypothetical protein
MAVITFMDGGGQVDNSLPSGPVSPGHDLPGGGGNYPSHGLPPGAVNLPVYPFAPGGRFIVKWFACHGLILVPDNTLPATPQPK